ncbi:MAG TPA: hypothetical protein VER96_17600 [Polyangiaceae bacterium]|nr:hypothetical protein [Polyangiaceae bacterium]
MRIACFALSFSSVLAIACGGAQSAPPAPPPTAETTVPAPEPAKTAPSAEAAKPEPSDAPAAADAPAAPEAAAKKDEPDPNATREVTYVVVPEGLKISVAGVRFAVSASAVQVASGWGVKLSVVATALDGKVHSLSNPKSGPMAFAGSVARKGKSEPDPFGDERSGDGEQEVPGDTPAKFSRTWPANGVRVLGAGDALDLQVALWGLGSDKDSRRPVKKFCHVRMKVDKGKPRAIVEPPQGVGK